MVIHHQRSKPFWWQVWPSCLLKPYLLFIWGLSASTYPLSLWESHYPTEIREPPLKAILAVFNPELQGTATTAVFKEISTSFTNIFNSLRKGLSSWRTFTCVCGCGCVCVGCDKNTQTFLISLDWFILHTKEYLVFQPLLPSLFLFILLLFFLFSLFVHLLLSHTPFFPFSSIYIQ